MRRLVFVWHKSEVMFLSYYGSINFHVYQAPGVRIFISLTSLLMTNLLTVVAKVFSNTLIHFAFLVQNCE